jgi:hypothetical protein
MKTRSISILAVMPLAAFSAAQAQVNPPVWQPKLQTSWQWQLTTPIDMNVNAEMFDIDLFDNSASVVSALHAKGRKAVCYISAGSWERWRPDSGLFPEAVKGSKLSGYANEKWLDARRWDMLGPIMGKRLDLCKSKGFDGVELDNVDAYANKSGFPLTFQDQITYNTQLAAAAHARGLSVGLKNDLAQVSRLVPYFDWALNEQCYQYKECGDLNLFIASGKPVFHVEYEVAPDKFCPYVNGLNFNSLYKHDDLDAYRVACRSTPVPVATKASLPFSWLLAWVGFPAGPF